MYYDYTPPKHTYYDDNLRSLELGKRIKELHSLHPYHYSRDGRVMWNVWYKTDH